jgi:hypothetical protein
MRRRLALAAASASILSLILAVTALAGGWANAVMDAPPNDPGGPNEPVTLGFTLMQHGVDPVDWGSAQIVLTNDGTGEEIIANAISDGASGHWTATVTLPTEGPWTYQVRHGDLAITLMGARPVSEGDGQAASSTDTAVTAISPALLAAGGLLAVLGMTVLVGVFLVVRHARPDEVRA